MYWACFIVGLLVALAWNFVHYPEAPFTTPSLEGTVIVGFASIFGWGFAMARSLGKIEERLSRIEHRLK
jgi:hypothetical protein